MKYLSKRTLLAFVLLVSFIGNLYAQKKKKLVITGKVTDYRDIPIKGAFIFLDSARTKVKTNKKGVYKIKISPDIKLITVFSMNHGMIDIDYKGAEVVNFIFPEGSNVVTEKELTDLGYDFSIYNGREESYDNYRTVFELLKSRFPNVRVVGETVRIIGTGTSVNGGSFAPIFLVNGTEVSNITSIAPVDIKSIVVDKTRTSRYGGRGAGGVIKITLKNK